MKTFVISLGGSIIVPDLPDVGFLKKFKTLIEKEIEKGNKFFIVCGGGKTCRNYVKSAAQITELNDEDLDWLGIHATRLNAHLMRTIFREHSHPNVIKDPTEKVETEKPIVIAAGWKPGFSTDYDAVMIAKNAGAKTVINLSNIKYVYTADPKLDKNAKPIKDITWQDFRKIVGDEWKPSANLPFDPVASKLAQDSGIEVAIMDGRDINNFGKFLTEGKFEGTLIK